MADDSGAGTDTGATGADTGAGGDGKGTDLPKTFTQGELDSIVKERLARAQAKVGDYDDLKKRAEAYDRLEEEQKSELQKAVDKAKTEATNTAKAETNAVWQDRLVRSEVKVAAAGKLADPNDAVNLIDLSEFKLDAEGNVDEKKIAAAIDKLVADKPYLAANGSRRGASFDAGARGAAPAGTDMNAFLRGGKATASA